MGVKFVRTTSTVYKRDERKLLPQHILGLFIRDVCGCAPIFLFFSTPLDGASTEYQISSREIFRFFAHALLWFSEKRV